MNKMLTSALTGAAVTAAVGTAAYLMNGKSPAKKRKQIIQLFLKSGFSRAQMMYREGNTTIVAACW